MPEAEQVRGMLASLEGAEVPAPDPLQQAIARARAAAAGGDFSAAAAAQEQAVALGRLAGEEREALVALSVLLYNLAGYYQQAGRHEDAVHALEKVVALDQRTGHPDLESDRQALDQARRLAAMPPEERERLQNEAQAGAMSLPVDALPPELVQRPETVAGEMDQLTPEERAKFEAAVQAFSRQLQAMSPEERAEFEAAARHSQIQSLADHARDEAIAALRGEAEAESVAARIGEIADQAAEGEEEGSAWYELAQYLRAVVALLRRESLPPVPPTYAAHLAAIQAER